MVTFELESITSDKVVYKYFPENNKESAYGVFSISLVNGDVVLEVVAEEYEEWYHYADHAIRRIKKVMEEGKVLEKGTVMWY